MRKPQNQEQIWSMRFEQHVVQWLWEFKGTIRTPDVLANGARSIALQRDLRCNVLVAPIDDMVGG